MIFIPKVINVWFRKGELIEQDCGISTSCNSNIVESALIPPNSLEYFEFRMEDPQKLLDNNFSVVFPHEARVEWKKYIMKTVNINLKVPWTPRKSKQENNFDHKKL